MPYVTLQQLAEIPGAQELAQVASDRHRGIVDAALMELTLLGGDRSAYSAEQVAEADQALARVQTAITSAEATVNGYIGRRYRLPLGAVPDVIAEWSRQIARYKLHSGRISDEREDPIARDYRDALRFLQQVADGRFSLGLDDPEAAPSDAGEVQIDTGRKVFGRNYLP